MNKYLILTIFIVSLISSCSDGELRGYEEISTDQKTYLVIEEDKGGGSISEVYIDNKLWEHSVGEKALIEPGTHTIGHSAESCNIRFFIKDKTVFHFNYWGP